MHFRNWSVFPEFMFVCAHTYSVVTLNIALYYRTKGLYQTVG